MDFLNNFLSKVYNTVGLKVLNEAAKDVKQLRLAGAVLIIGMFAAAGLFAFRGNWVLAIGSVFFFVIVMVLLIILGAVDAQQNSKRAAFLSWSIVILFVAFLAVLLLSFAFKWPQPLRELFQLEIAVVSLDGVEVKLKRDPQGNLEVTASKAPRQPYSLNVHLWNPETNELLKSGTLPLPAIGDENDPSMTLVRVQKTEKVACELTLQVGNKVVQTLRQTIKVPN